MLGMENMRGGQGMYSPAAIFMRAKAEDPNSLWMSTILKDKNEQAHHLRLMASTMRRRGYVNVTTIQTTMLASNPAIGGVAREQGLKAEVGARAAMARMRGMMGRMFGMGRGGGIGGGMGGY
jgi:hypothetical protein